MLSFTWDTVRLFLHIVAATIWVGGQLTLAALVPTLRAFGTEAPGAAARRFNQIAWPAFAVLVLTGIWNIAAEADKQSHPGYQATLGIKMALVLAVRRLRVPAHPRTVPDRPRRLGRRGGPERPGRHPLRRAPRRLTTPQRRCGTSRWRWATPAAP